MQSASLFLQNALKQGENLTPAARVIAEWNHNRYTKVTTVDNYQYAEKTYGYDLDMYPIETIINPVRPTAGLLKARAGEGAVVQGYSDTVAGYRTYTADPDSKYKYWTGPAQSNTTPYAGGGYTLPEPVRPHIIYENPVLTNKIYICVEDSWARPQKYDIQITTNGTTWTTVASDIVTNSKGQVILYLQDAGTTWSTTVARDFAMYIKGIKLVVNSMNRINSWFNLVELGARLEKDLSDRLIDYSIKNELGDVDFVTPMGTISSNTGSVTLSNYDGIFHADNPDSPYKGLIDANVKFTLDFGIDVSDWGGSGVEYIRVATMYSENWSGGDESVQVPLKDASKFLQEIKPLQELMQDVTIGMAIWRMLDSVGFVDYAYTRDAEVASNKIPFYWTDDEKTVWDHIQDLCRVTQSACYFDEHGILQIKTRDSAFNKTKPVSWTFDYAQNGSKQPDIVSLDVNGNFEANKVTVKYQKTNLAQDSQGRPISEVVWQPDDTVVLRSSNLTTAINKTDMRFWIDKKDIATWPYEGMVNVRGELIKYKGKGYRYYPKGGSYTGNIDNDTVFKVIYSADEKLQVDNELSSSVHGWRNYFTGYMKVVERGYDRTTAQDHDLVQDVWLTNGSYYGLQGGTQKLWNGGTKFMVADGILRLQSTGKKATGNHWYTARRGSWVSESPKFIGTRMKFPSNPKGKHTAAGIWVWGNLAQNEMYAIDIKCTKNIDRKTHNEIRVLKRNNGNVTQIGGKGAVVAIDYDKWYDVDVVVTSTARFTVSINGVKVLNVIDDGTDLPISGRAGLYVRGDCVTDFEYFYMMADGGIQETDLDNSSYLDLIRGGYYSNQYYRDFVTRTRIAVKRRGRKPVWYTQWYDQRYFDEFGQQVHEYRPYEVTFEKSPVLYSSLYISNDSQIVQDEYVHNPFGAKFIVANASRFNSVANGEDTLTFGADNPVDQKMMITGRTVQQGETTDYVVKNDVAINARGEIAIEFSSPWIQSEAAAKALGDWIVNNWAQPSDEIEMEVFGNPLLQIGDVVSVNYSPRDMTAATHKYFITAIDNNWDNGLTTVLSLRRARI
ncbi:minor tail protein [Streptomyces phage TunaTartare]|uniref:Minor tail protein n=1 Tax=Streptomyces phage TunaTartare TaxID=2848887 RepID=A0A8F2E6M0_9CAUD|nr:minor tail protein [Streptomyces phage TunaTartare]QWT29932.1 minor tail protein [Streptomyces phage TunaTartare]